MMAKDNTGSVFPDELVHDMSVRAYFAGQALANAHCDRDPDTIPEEVADWAVEVADAMLVKLKE